MSSELKCRKMRVAVYASNLDLLNKIVWAMLLSKGNSLARLAQSVERKTLNLEAAGSTPASGSIPVLLRFFFGDITFTRSYFRRKPLYMRSNYAGDES